jgi:hypothetical protein
MALKDLPVNKPSRYYGQIDPVALKTWISEIASLCKLHLRDEPYQWVHYAAQNRAGSASSWYATYNPDDDDIEWEQFVQDIKSCFFPADYENMIMDEFESLRCEGDNVSDYNNRFGTLMTEVPAYYQSEKIRMHRYLKGLPPYIRMYVRQGKAETLRELMQAAQQWQTHVLVQDYDRYSPFTAQMYRPRSTHHQKPITLPRPSPTNFVPPGRNYRQLSDPKPWTPKSTHSNFAPFGRNDRQLPDPEPMDLSTIRRERGSYNPLTRSEREELLRTGMCFYCKKGQHYSKNCPLRRSKNARGQY